MFDSKSERTVFVNNGVSRVTGLTVEAAYGGTEHVTLAFSLPVLAYRLQDDLVLEEGKSLGDLRLTVKVSRAVARFAAALETTIKFPTATAKDPTRVQIGEGQHDVEVVGSFGHQPPLAGGAVSADVGHRWRFRNEETRIHPGNEWIYRVELLSSPLRRLSVRTSLDGFVGAIATTDIIPGQAIPIVFSQRRMTAVTPEIVYRLTERIGLEVVMTRPLAGQSIYAGTSVVVGVSYNRSDYRTTSGIGVPTPRGGSCCRIQ
jgi:hypothetical protein